MVRVTIFLWSSGRFQQEDVYQGDGRNLYAYCGNNPVVYDDLSGYAKKACPPQGEISEGVDKTSYGKSSEKLNWDAIVSKKGETRVEHIKRHTVQNNS